jgi:hypothetical protein
MVPLLYSAGLIVALIGVVMIARATFRGSGAGEAIGGFLLIAAVVILSCL